MVRNLKKKFLLLIKDIKSDNKQATLLLFLLLLYITYLGSRSVNNPAILIIWLFCMYYAGLMIYRNKIYNFLVKYQKWPVILLAVLVLLWSLIYHRTDFGDGPNLYFRNAYLVTLKGYSSVLQGALPPYLTELFLGLVGRFFGHNIMVFLFGVATLASLYTSYLLYKRLGFNSFVIKSSLIILAFSPTLIMLTVREFKVEPFLLFVTNLFLLLLVKTYSKPSLLSFALLGLLAGVSFLIKFSVLPLILFAPLMLLAWFVRNKILSIKRALILFLSFLTIFLFAVFLWLIYTPAYFPVIGKIDLFKRINDFTDLERHQDILNQCHIESSYRDYSSWIHYKNELWLLLQPLQYLFMIGFNLTDSIITIANPGLFLYFGLWLFPFSAYLLYKQGNLLGFVLYTLCLPFVLILFYLSKTAFWYLFPAYPLIAAAIPILADYYLKTKTSRDLFKFLVVSLGIVYMVCGIAFAWSHVLAFGTFGKTKLSEIIYDMSKKAQELSKDHYILDATQHVYISVLPFMDNYGEKLIKSDFYFASSKKGVDQMKDELLSKDIKYIIARKDKLFDEWYTGCPLRNNELLFQFLEKHTKMIYESKYRYNGEIYEIID